MRVHEFPSICTECHEARPCVLFTCIWKIADKQREILLCAECIRIAGIILARAEKDAAKDQVPRPEGERK